MEMPMRNKTQKEQGEHLSSWNCWLFSCISKYSFYFSWIYNEKAVKIFLKKSWFNQKVQNACFESIEDGQDMEERAQIFIFIKLVFTYIYNWISLCHTWFYNNEAVRKNFFEICGWCLKRLRESRYTRSDDDDYLYEIYIYLSLQSKNPFSDTILQRRGCENFSHGMSQEVLGMKGWREQRSDVVWYGHENIKMQMNET